CADSITSSKRAPRLRSCRGRDRSNGTAPRAAAPVHDGPRLGCAPGIRNLPYPSEYCPVLSVQQRPCFIRGNTILGSDSELLGEILQNAGRNYFSKESILRRPERRGERECSSGRTRLGCVRQKVN